MKKKENSTVIWGGKSQSRILINMLINKSYNSKYLKKKLKLISIIDPFLKKPDFKTNIPFTNNKTKFNKYLLKSNSFIVGIGGHYGKARALISQEFIKKNLKPLNIVSEYSYIDKTASFGMGIQIMPNVVVHCFSNIGNFCILNTSSTIDHECNIGNGVHIMGGTYLGGRVKIGDYVTIGSNATIFPDVEIKKGAFIGAGAIVRKNVSENQIVVGNPAKFIKKNKHYFDLRFFKKNV